jgi:hypothetical protein
MRGERGDDNVAAAIIYSAILLVAWAVIQVAVVLLGRGVALEAARDGVRSARLPAENPASAVTAAEAYTREVTGTWLSDVHARASSDSERVTVTVTGEATSLVPFARFPISQTASGPIERLKP